MPQPDPYIASAEALFRFSVVSQVLGRMLRDEVRSEAVQNTAAHPHATLDGQIRPVSVRTLYRWLLAYREGGVEGLEPASRPRVEASNVLELALLDFLAPPGPGCRAPARATRPPGPEALSATGPGPTGEGAPRCVAAPRDVARTGVSEGDPPHGIRRLRSPFLHGRHRAASERTSRREGTTTPMSCGRTRRCLKFAIRNQTGRDGFDDYGYTVTCPHYAGMVMAEYREHVPTFERLLFFGYHSPMNAVESIAVDGNDRDYWNHHTRSWTLSLQTLGLRRALSGDRYVPYQELRTNNYLRSGYEELMPGSEL